MRREVVCFGPRKAWWSMSKSTLVGLVVSGALMGILAGCTGNDQAAGNTEVSFTALPRDQVDRIEINDRVTTVLVRRGNHWFIQGGRRADPSSIQQVLETIMKIHSSEVVSRDPQSYAEYRVDETTGVEVAVSGGGRELAHFVIGSGGPGSSNVRVAGDVFRVPEVYAGSFKRKGTGWADRTIIELESKDIAEVSFQIAEDAYTLVSTDSGWQVKDTSALPEGFRFDARGAAELVSELLGLRVREFIEADPGPDVTGLAAGADVVTLRPKAPGAHALVLKLGSGRADDTVYAALSTGDIFTLSKHTAARLRTQLMALRDLDLMDFDPDEVRELALRDGKRHLVLTRADEGWAVKTSSEVLPERFILDSMAVEGQLRLFEQLRAAMVLVDRLPEEAGLGRGDSWVRLSGSAGVLAVLHFGKFVGEGAQAVRCVQTTEGKEVYGLASAMVERVLVPLDALRKRTQMMPPGGVSGIDPSSLSKLPPVIREQILKQLAEQERAQSQTE